MMANSYSVTSGMSTEEYHRAQLAGNIVKSDAQIEAEEIGCELIVFVVVNNDSVYSGKNARQVISIGEF
jgi:hypothetical protein